MVLKRNLSDVERELALHYDIKSLYKDKGWRPNYSE
jgi:hypothetical protein